MTQDGSSDDDTQSGSDQDDRPQTGEASSTGRPPEQGTGQTDAASPSPQPAPDKAKPASPPAAAPAPAAVDDYDAVAAYEPEKEFQFIVDERSEIDKELATHTRPYAQLLVRLHKWTAWMAVWSALAIPLIEAVQAFTAPLPWWLRLALILAPPLVLWLCLLIWRFGPLRRHLLVTDYEVRMYVDDDVARKLEADDGTYRAAVKDLDVDTSQDALLNLLRLRMRAFHSWHRISVHPIMFEIGMRGDLETRLRAPRFYVAMAPVFAIFAFVVYHMTVALERGVFSDLAAAVPLLAMQIADSLWANQIPIPGLSVPSVAVIVLGYVLATRSYRLVVETKAYIGKRLGKMLDIAGILTPWTHDSSLVILQGHRRLLEDFRKLMFRFSRGPEDKDH